MEWTFDNAVAGIDELIGDSAADISILNEFFENAGSPQTKQALVDVMFLGSVEHYPSWLFWRHSIRRIEGHRAVRFSGDEFLEFLLTGRREDVRAVFNFLEDEDLGFTRCWQESECTIDEDDLESDNLFVKKLAHKINAINDYPLEWADVFDSYHRTSARIRWRAIRFYAYLVRLHRESVERVNHPDRVVFSVFD